jgi:GntR family transcriptional regulator, trigonelline degradation regulator
MREIYMAIDRNDAAAAASACRAHVEEAAEIARRILVP